MSSNEVGLNKILIAIGNTRQKRGYGGNGTAELERRGLVMIDPEWSGCLTLTAEGWKLYEYLMADPDA